MADEPTPRFHVDRLPRALEQIKELAAKAKQRSLTNEFLDGLEDAVSRIGAGPLEWGDPTYHTQVGNGVVCRGISWPVIVYYVVFEAHRSVVVLDVLPYPGAGLD
jgi:hypothetical protein